MTRGRKPGSGSGRDAMLNVRVHPTMLAALDALARDSGLSRSDMVRVILAEALTGT